MEAEIALLDYGSLRQVKKLLQPEIGSALLQPEIGSVKVLSNESGPNRGLLDLNFDAKFILILMQMQKQYNKYKWGKADN